MISARVLHSPSVLFVSIDMHRGTVSASGAVGVVINHSIKIQEYIASCLNKRSKDTTQNNFEMLHTKNARFIDCEEMSCPLIGRH